MVATLDPFLIVGAGLSGLLAARDLRALGYKVIVLEQAGYIGGRMATRDFNGARFDSGAQFFTVRDPQFRQLVNEWLDVGVAELWSKGFATETGHRRQDGHERYRGEPGMGSIPRYLAHDLDVRLHHRVEAAEVAGSNWRLTLDNREPLEGRALLLTAPLPQSLAVLEAGGYALPRAQQAQLEAVEYAPCLALLVELEERSEILAPGGLQLHGEPIQFIADNTQKGISPASYTVTIHAGPRFSADHWASPDEQVAQALLDDASYWIKAPVKRWHLERWRHSIPREIIPRRLLHVPGPPTLVLAGDVFGGPRVEGAALSGLAAAETLIPGSGRGPLSGRAA